MHLLITSTTSAFETLQSELVCIHSVAYAFSKPQSLGLSLSLSLFFLKH